MISSKHAPRGTAASGGNLETVMKRFVAGCLLGALGAVVVANVPLVQAQNSANTVQAPFMVLGASGQPIMVVDEATKGFPAVTIYGTGGASAVQLGVNGAFPGIQILNQNGLPVASIGALPAGGGAGAVKVADGQGALAAYMQGAPSGNGVVAVKLGATDVVRLEPNSSNTGGKVTVGDTNGNVAVQVGLLSNGSGAVCTFDGNGQHC